MRVKRKNIMLLAMVSALLLIVLYALTGCGSKPVENTGAQPPAQQQAATTETTKEQTAAQVTPETVPVNEKQEKAPPILINSTFEMGHYGWSTQAGTIMTETNGNKYMRVGYTWGLFQFMQVTPGQTYQIYCKAKQGTEPASPARLSIMFYDKDHKIMKESVSFYHYPGAEWSSFPKKAFTVPENALFTKLFILSNGKGTVSFDNISVSLLSK